jgi:2-iminobutanoate/2-iminopropanoate deaminase
LTERELIQLPGVPPTAPYCSAVRVGDLVWTSGQLPIDQNGNTPADFTEQVELTLDNLERALHEAGASLATLVKVSAFVTNIEDLPAMNAVYRRRIGVHGAPARTTVQIAAFRGASMIEVDAVAVVTGKDGA